MDEEHEIDRLPGGDPFGDAAVDRAYVAAYEEHPIDEPDAWGDLVSFRSAAARA